MVYLTGDIHGRMGIRRLFQTEWLTTATKDDVLIICGDFGLIWDTADNFSWTEAAWMECLNRQPYTTLFVDGNHENFDRIDKLPITTKYGGKVHQVSEKIFHLMRGEYYIIQGYSFWVMGGATSIDQWCRIPKISWWAQEMPTHSERLHGLEVLEEHENKVDYILTHCAPSNLLEAISPWYESDELNSYLKVIYNNIEFKHWYCGHYHQDREIADNFTILYRKIIPIKI